MKLRLFALLIGVVALALSVNGQSSFTFLNQLRDTNISGYKRPILMLNPGILITQPRGPLS